MSSACSDRLYFSRDESMDDLVPDLCYISRRNDEGYAADLLAGRDGGDRPCDDRDTVYFTVLLGKLASEPMTGSCTDNDSFEAE